MPKENAMPSPVGRREMRAIVGLVLLSSSPVAAIASFPEVVPLDARFTFQRPEQANLKVDILITGAGGTEDGYTLQCHTWRQSERNARSDFDYSGDFECRLLAVNGDNPIPTLLGHEIPMARDWDSRGRFLAEQLVGKCGEHPDYGRTRTFKLRGMRLTLTIQDAEVQLESVDHQSPLRHDVLGRLSSRCRLRRILRRDLGSRSHRPIPSRLSGRGSG